MSNSAEHETVEIEYADGEWPEVVVVFMTWSGPPERDLSQTRAEYAERSIQSVRQYLHYPNLSWHIADDGSHREHQDKIKALFADVEYTFSDTGKGWDVNNNWNRAARVAFDRADLMVLWPDDRFPRFDIDLKPFVRLLMSYDDICDIRLKPKLPGHVVTPLERVGQKWWRVGKKATTSREVVAYFGMKHKRYIDHYGFLPTGIWPVKHAAAAMNKRFRSIPGPDAVVPDVIQSRTEAAWGPKSTYSGEPPPTPPPWNGKETKISVVGPFPLRGSVKVSGAKNVVLPAMAVSLLLARGKIQLENTPQLTDVAVQARLLRSLGASVIERKDSMTIDVDGKLNSVVSPDLGSQIRYSLLMLGALLSRCGEVTIPLPGGCSIGERRFDMHLDGLRAMGASIDLSGNTIHAECRRLKGATITFRYPTFSGTINIMAAAVLADGTTTIKNAATNPEIVNVAYLLHKMGAKITGAGTRTLTIEGVKSLRGCRHACMADRIETLTFLAAGAITGGDIVVDGCSPGVIAKELEALRAAGAIIECVKQEGIDSPEQRVHIVGPEKLQAVSVATSAYPGFHTDFQPLFSTLMTLADGRSTITETIIEGRFSHLGELSKMGAKIEIRDGDFVCPNGERGHVAIIDGVDVLHGVTVRCNDLRAGAALLIAGLAADGETIIKNANVIDRGYEDIGGKLLGLRAYISRQ